MRRKRSSDRVWNKPKVRSTRTPLWSKSPSLALLAVLRIEVQLLERDAAHRTTQRHLLRGGLTLANRRKLAQLIMPYALASTYLDESSS